VLASSASRSDSTVAGMLRDTISAIVLLIFVDAYKANSEPTTVMLAAKPKAKKRRDRIVLTQESMSSPLNRG